MKKKLAFLHTLTANIAVFDELLRECDYTGEVVHRVNESVLKDTMELGRFDDGIADRIRAAMR